MLRIRLTRTGKKKQPTYRFVVAEQKAPIKGKFIEILGHYNPRTEPKTIVIDKEKAKSWMDKGAKPSSTVADLFVTQGILKKSDLPPKPTLKRPKKVELKKEKEVKKPPKPKEAVEDAEITKEKEEVPGGKKGKSQEVEKEEKPEKEDKSTESKSKKEENIDKK
jgi:small subunit ribosomal protein S16